MLRPSEVLSVDERQALTQKSDIYASWLVLRTWLEILTLLALAAAFPGVVTALLVLLLLPGRQLSLAVLMHEAGHGTLFSRPGLNAWVGQWLCALPVLNDLHSYASGHLEHHRRAGTHEDPDLPNYAAYPVDPTSFRRKVIRDLTGQTGFKLLAYVFSGGAGVWGEGRREGRLLLLKQIAVQLIFVLVLSALGMGWTWWLWFATFMATYMLVVRLRQVAEHAAVPDLYDPDPRMNTRTVEAPFWQTFLLAPNNVNYHMEHHFMAGVPCYRLPQLRRLLEARGCLEAVPAYRSYRQVFEAAVANS